MAEDMLQTRNMDTPFQFLRCQKNEDTSLRRRDLLQLIQRCAYIIKCESIVGNKEK